MDRQEWLEERRKGLGGSDIAALCGESPWMTPYQLYLDKRGELPPQEENEAMFWGSALEPVIRQRYADVTGFAVATPKEALVHPEYPFMRANVDGLLPDRVLEVKTARSSQDWGEPGTDEIPEPYLLQCIHYMSVTQRELADVAVLFHGNDFQIYTVELDKEMECLLIEREQVFWKMVEDGVPPDPKTFEDVKLRFGAKSEAIEVYAPPEICAKIIFLKEIKEKGKALEEEEKALKTEVMSALGDADTLLGLAGELLCTWKMDKPGKRFDQKILKEKFPDVFAQCEVDKNPTRRFLLKS